MLLTKLIENHTSSRLSADILIGTDNVFRLALEHDGLFAIRVHEFLRHARKLGHHQIGLLISLRTRIAPLLDLGIWAFSIIQGLRGANHQELHGRHPIRVLIRVHKQPPRGKHTHQRGLAILSGHKHNHLAKAIAAIFKQFERMDEQPLLPRVKVNVQHDLREGNHRETIASGLIKLSKRRGEDSRKRHTMLLIINGTENTQIFRRHRTPPISRNAS